MMDWLAVSMVYCCIFTDQSFISSSFIKVLAPGFYLLFTQLTQNTYHLILSQTG